MKEQPATASNHPHVPRQLWFTNPFNVEVRPGSVVVPEAGEVLVATHCSAVSAGTELLLYRGQLPQGMALDASLEALNHHTTYPLQYGYACVGRVEQLGPGVDARWLGQRVFAFQPHASHFICPPEQLIPIPDDIADEDAVFLANAETAVNLVQDGAPLLGERVVVLGLGIVGLLLAGMLRQFPLQALIGLDTRSDRRELAEKVGVAECVDPGAAEEIAQLKQRLAKGADLIFEVTGVPDALNLAIELSGFASRIVVGSWYGEKSAPVFLGGEAHRNRLRITTSQVSSLAPELCGRWDKTRRFAVAWDRLRHLRPSQWVSHRVHINDAPALYRQLDGNAREYFQVLFVYSH